MMFKKMNKHAEMVLRDIIFVVIVFTGIIALSGIFINEMGDTYDNTNMTSSYNQDSYGSDELEDTESVWKEIAENLDGNLLQMLTGTYQAVKEILSQIILAPVTFSVILGNVLEDLGVSGEITNIFVIIVSVALYVLIVFALISAFLRGGKM